MKLRNKGLAVALTATLGLGVAGEAAADVYGLSYLQLDDLVIEFEPVVGGSGAGIYTLATGSEATLNGAVDPSNGGDACAGVFGGADNCGAGAPRVSGIVQNAPGGDVARGENDYQKFGSGNAEEYSNAEAAIDSAVLVGDAMTNTRQISESNLVGGASAQASTNVDSNTILNIEFETAGDGNLHIDFLATIDVHAEVIADLGIAQANSAFGLVLTQEIAGVTETLVEWRPDGSNGVLICDASLVCVAMDNGNSLNHVNASGGAANQETFADEMFALDVSGLEGGTYNLALAAFTSTNLNRIPQAPVPGTLLLLGTGLLLGARTLRRK